MSKLKGLRGSLGYAVSTIASGTRDYHYAAGLYSCFVDRQSDADILSASCSRGAQNQYPGQIDFYQRKQNALKAYTEWLPLRWNFTSTPEFNRLSDYAINRTFQFGESNLHCIRNAHPLQDIPVCFFLNLPRTLPN